MTKIKEFISENIITQEKYEASIKRYLAKCKSDEEKAFILSTLNGTECPKCKIKPTKERIKTKIADYEMYTPECNCYSQWEIKHDKIDTGKRLISFAEIPEKLKDVRISDMDMNIKESTQNAIKKVKTYLQKKAYTKNIGIILYGSVGTGKTHMAICILKNIITELRCKGLFIHMSDIITEIFESRFDYIKTILANKVICLDDIDKIALNSFHGENEWKAERIFSLINNLTSENRIIIATSNCSNINELIMKFDQSIISRLTECCRFVKVEGDDYRLRKAM